MWPSGEVVIFPFNIWLCFCHVIFPRWISCFHTEKSNLGFYFLCWIILTACHIHNRRLYSSHRQIILLSLEPCTPQFYNLQIHRNAQETAWKSIKNKVQFKLKTYVQGLECNILKSGFLFKKGEKGILKLWKNRFFALYQTHLEYKEVPSGPCLGKIHLYSTTMVEEGKSWLTLSQSLKNHQRVTLEYPIAVLEFSPSTSQEFIIFKQAQTQKELIGLLPFQRLSLSSQEMMKEECKFRSG